MTRYVTKSFTGLGRLVLAGLCFFIFIFAVQAGYWIFALMSAVLASLAAWSDWQRSKQYAEQNEQSQQKIISVAKKQIEKNEWPTLQLFTKNRLGWAIFIFIVVASSTFLVTELIFKIFSAVIGLYVCFWIFLIVANWRTPLLELTTDGIKLPLVGKIVWSDCLGVSFTTHKIKSSTLSFLCLKLQRPIKIKWSLTAFTLYGGRLGQGQRLNKKLSDVIRVCLDNIHGYEPETVSEFACLLWQADTGKDYRWYESMSDELLALEIRSNTLQKEIFLKNKGMLNQFEQDKEKGLRSLLNDGRELQQKLSDMASLQAQIQTKTKHELRQAKKLMMHQFLIFGLIVFIFILVKFVGNH